MELYKDYKLRKSFEDLVSPLIKDGIDDLAIKEYGKEDYLCQITKDEKDLLEKLRQSPNFHPKPDSSDKGFFSKMKEYFQ